MKNKKHIKRYHALKITLWITIGVAVIAFGALFVLLRSTINNIHQDPTLATLTQDTTFKIVQIINTNKNKYEDTDKCWNQKNPLMPCSENNTLEIGLYTLHGNDNTHWLEGPHTDLLNDNLFLLSPSYVKSVLNGFVVENQNYTQNILITYPDNPDTMHVTVETRNSDEQTYEQFIILTKE